MRNKTVTLTIKQLNWLLTGTAVATLVVDHLVIPSVVRWLEKDTVVEATEVDVEDFEEEEVEDEEA